MRSVWRRLYIHDEYVRTNLKRNLLFIVHSSWATLQQTVGLSDTQINNNLRATMLYQTFRENALVDKDYVPTFFTPLEASDLPLLQDLERRWAGFSAEDLQTIMGDYEWERNALSENGVADVYEQVRRLEQADRGVS